MSLPRAARLDPCPAGGSDADIVLLQELVPQRVKTALAAALRDLYPHGVPASGRTRRFYGTGLLTLSRHPTEDAACVPFAEQTFEEGLFGPRGMLSCTVRTPALGPPAASSTSTPRPAAPLAGGGARVHRAGRARRLPKRSMPPPAPFEGTVVLAGDFNSDPASDPATHRSLSAAGFADVATGLPEAARPPGTWDPANPLNRGKASGAPRRVDHIFLRPPGGRGVETGKVRIVLDEPVVPVPGGDPLPLSDHHGLLATLTPA